MNTKTKIYYHKGDLPKTVSFKKAVAVDTETMGLNLQRDRLCVVQLSSGDGIAHIVQLKDDYHAPYLKKILSDPKILKIFHYARFDVAMLYLYLNVLPTPIFCTKIASRLTRTNTDSHGLKNLCEDLLNVKLSKQQQTSDWGADKLSAEQLEYAAADVLYLHDLKEKLEKLLKREDRLELAQACFDFVFVKALLDIEGFENIDIFAHS